MKAQTPQLMPRVIGLKETITITVGTVIGVGLFTVGASAASSLGPAVLFATLLAMLISIYPAKLYGEMSASLPLSGGTYQYARYGLCKPLGMLAGWNFVISMISVASGEALAFSFYLRTLFEALGVGIPLSDPVIGCIAILLFTLLGISGVKMSGKLQNAFLFFFWGVAIVWVCTMIPHISFGNFVTPFATFTPSNFFTGVAMIWWCFAGFETCCSLGEEIKTPQLNLPRALALAPFLVFAVNGLFQWVLVCIVPADGLAAVAAAAAPYAEAMRTAGVVGFPLILLCLGIALGGDFSTLNASILAPSRYLQSMARDGSLPKFFAYVGKRTQAPVFAVVIPGAVTALLVLTNSVSFIACLSLFATLLYYIIGMCAACGLRKRFPKLERPYKAKGIYVGAAISIAIYLALMTQLEWKAIVLGLAWNLIGLAVFYGCRLAHKRKLCPDPKVTREEAEAFLTKFQSELPPIPKGKELKKLNRTYLIWKIATAVVFTVILGLNIAAFIIR